MTPAELLLDQMEKERDALVATVERMKRELNETKEQLLAARRLLARTPDRLRDTQILDDLQRFYELALGEGRQDVREVLSRIML